MAIFLNPCFATDSVYARNASIVVKVFIFSFKHCPSLLILESKFVFADLQYRLFCFDFCVFIYFVFMSFFLYLVTRISSLNIKFIVFVLQLLLYSKNVRVTSRRLETGSTSSGSTLQEEVWQVCIVDSFYLWKCYIKLHKSFVGSHEVQCPWLFTHNRNVSRRK